MLQILHNIRKYVVAVLILTVTSLVTSPVAYAGIDLDGAFNDLTSASVAFNRPGAIHGAINGMVLGGIEVRVGTPAGAVQLLSITPPRLKLGGCGGISAWFGGFTFITAEQIKQMIKNISQGAIAFVVNLVIKTLCPMCGSILDSIQALAQAAARLAMDGCHIGASLANDAVKALNDGKPIDPAAAEKTAIDKCNEINVRLGNAKDNIASSDAASPSAGCAMDNGIKAMTKWLGGQANAINGWSGFSSVDEHKTSIESSPMGVYNSTWQALGAIGFDYSKPGMDATQKKRTAAMRLILTNLLGTSIKYPDVFDGSDIISTSVANSGSSARLSPEELLGVMMCGIQTYPTSYGAGMPAPSPDVASFCHAVNDNASKNLKSRMIKTCPDVTELGTAGNISPSTLVLSGINSWISASQNQPMLKNLCIGMAAQEAEVPLSLVFDGVKGLAQRVDESLMCAVAEVRKGPAGDIGGRCPDALSLMQMTPYPIYQAINYAAVYPSAGEAFLNSVSLLTSQLLAVSMMENSLRAVGSFEKTAIPADAIKRVDEARQAMMMDMRAIKDSQAGTLTFRESLTRQVQQMNAALQKEVMVNEMAGPIKYHETLIGGAGIKGGR